MFILNQDKDRAYKFTEQILKGVPVFFKGKLIAFNLFMGDEFLGTFDTPAEIRDEIELITTCSKELYEVQGYSDYDGKGDFDALCKMI